MTDVGRLATVLLCIGVIGLFIGMYIPEHPRGNAVVAFQNGKMTTAYGGMIYLDRPLSIEALEGEVSIPGTTTMYVRYNLTSAEAEILGQGFGEYLANNCLVEEFLSPGLGFKSFGYKTPLPNGVDPTHIVLVQKA
jgi:hypothetical protein